MEYRATNCTQRALQALAICLTWLSVSTCLADDAHSDNERAPELRLKAAQQLLQSGNYAESLEQFAPLLKRQLPEAAVGTARAFGAIGKREEATATLAAARQRFPKNADILAESARLAFETGDPKQTREFVDGALKSDESQLLARWLDAELLRTSGQIEAADAANKWFVDYYNRTEQFQQAEDLILIGQAAAQYARWNRLSDQFSFLVNDLYPAALELDKGCWQAHWQAALIFLEKFNEADAAKEIDRGLRVNPNSAELLVAKAQLALQRYELGAAKDAAERALEINPNYLPARLLLADIQFANFEPRDAEQLLAQALPLNPRDEQTLGRLAAAYLVVDEPRGDVPDSRLKKLATEVITRNPAAGAFYEALADSLDRLRKWPDSVHYYEEAIRLLPQSMSTRGKLGLVHMRLADEAAARAVLEESFEIDPFNVRVKNSLAVLDVLDEYATLETDHFIVRYDEKKDALLARHIADYLEEIYPEVCDSLGYHPREKTLFEIFSSAKNTSAHGWFSARMVGLPHVHTIAACAGKVVAITSPAELGEPVNWARIIKHEFVHIINLQQTNFNIPHWYTEALAVHHEQTPRSEEWNRMLARRVPKGETFNLQTINLGFIRPSSSDDWQMAYCQAELYAEYMLERFGDDALIKLLEAYAANNPTPQAIVDCFGVSVEDFERGYTAKLNQIVADMPALDESKRRSVADLDRALRDNPRDADALAEMAVAYIRREAFPQAGEFAKRALAVDDKQPLALYVQARLQLTIGNTAEAIALLEQSVAAEPLSAEPLRLLAAVRYKQDRYADAARLYQRGRAAFLGDSTWNKALARVYLKSGEKQKLQAVLRELAAPSPDDLTIHKLLAKMAIESQDYAAAKQWARHCIHIDVHDVELHRMLAEAHAGLKEYDQAARRYRIALEIDPQSSPLRFALADALVSGDKQQEAIVVLKQLLANDPTYPGADVLLEGLESSASE